MSIPGEKDHVGSLLWYMQYLVVLVDACGYCSIVPKQVGGNECIPSVKKSDNTKLLYSGKLSSGKLSREKTFVDW